MSTSGCIRRQFLLCIFAILFVSPALCWDEDNLELYDLVEEINQNFYDVLGVTRVKNCWIFSFCYGEIVGGVWCELLSARTHTYSALLMAYFILGDPIVCAEWYQVKIFRRYQLSTLLHLYLLGYSQWSISDHNLKIETWIVRLTDTVLTPAFLFCYRKACQCLLLWAFELDLLSCTKGWYTCP